jgi:hypothetical protein
MLTKYLPVFPIFGDGQSLFRMYLALVLYLFTGLEPIHVDDLAGIIVNAIQSLPSSPVSSATFEVGGPKGM